MYRRVLSLTGMLLLAVSAAAAWMSHYSVDPRRLFVRLAPAEADPEALATRVDLDVREAPWREVIADWSKAHRLNVEYDEFGLSSLAIDDSRPHSFRVEGIPLGSLLNLFLRRVHPEVTYYVRDGVVWISSVDRMLGNVNHFETKVHACGDLMAAGRSSWSGEELLRLVREAAPLESWQQYGGSGSARAIPGGIIVTHSPFVQKRVEELLRGIDELNDERNEIKSRMLEPSVDEQKIRDALREDVSCDFQGIPLDAALEQLGRDRNVVIWLDGAVSEGDSQIDFRVKDVPLSTALELMLSSRDLTFLVRDGVVLVTTEGEAQSLWPSALYRIDDLNLEFDESSYWSISLLVGKMISSSRWRGRSESAVEINDMLFVRDSRSRQRMIGELLGGLREEQDYRLLGFGVDPERCREVAAALDRPNRIRCQDRPLGQVLREIEGFYDISTWTDQACDSAFVTIEGEHASLRDALRAAFGTEFDLFTDRGLLEIYPASARLPTSRLCSLHSVINEPFSILETLASSVDPRRSRQELFHAWNLVGGERIVVTGVFSYHELTAKLLNGLACFREDGSRTDPVNVGPVVDGGPEDETLPRLSIRVYAIPELLACLPAEQARDLIIDFVDGPIGAPKDPLIPFFDGYYSIHAPALVAVRDSEAHERLDSFLSGLRSVRNEKVERLQLVAPSDGREGSYTCAYSLTDLIAKYRLRLLPSRTKHAVSISSDLTAMPDRLTQMILVNSLVPAFFEHVETASVRRVEDVLILHASEGVHQDVWRLIDGLCRLEFDEASVVTIADDASKSADDDLVVKVYDVRRHVDESIGYTAEELRRAVSSVVQPRSWNLFDGSVTALEDVLVVGNTIAVHREVESLLDELALDSDPVARHHRSSHEERRTIVDQLLSRLDDGNDERTVALALHHLTDLRSDDPRIVPVLVDLLQTTVARDDADGLIRTCRCLRAFGPNAESALPVLDLMLDRLDGDKLRDAAIRKEIYGAILSIGDSALPALIERVKHDSFKDTLQLMASIDEAEQVPLAWVPVLMIILTRSDDDDSMSSRARELLEHVDPDGRECVRVLRCWRDGEDEDLRERAERFAGQPEDPFRFVPGGYF